MDFRTSETQRREPRDDHFDGAITRATTRIDPGDVICLSALGSRIERDECS